MFVYIFNWIVLSIIISFHIFLSYSVKQNQFVYKINTSTALRTTQSSLNVIKLFMQNFLINWWLILNVIS